MKRLVFMLIAVIIVISLAACGTEDGQALFPTEQPSTGAPAVKQGAVTMLFTGGLNGNHRDGHPQGSASYAALKKRSLDFVTLACQSYRRGPQGVEHLSGYLCLDIDHVGSEELLQHLKQCFLQAANLFP